MTGDAALIRAVRALDNGDADTTPDRLERVWDTLENRDREGSFHAAEEMLLRWLLKNMTGTSANAERIRRYPRVWDILGAVFALIPLFSLAKSLADRRFVAILQQTLKDIATPQQAGGAGADGTQKNGTDSDVDMADAPPLDAPTNPRKRKRTDPASFDAAIQSQAPGCLQTAHALFEAIRVLLARCEIKSLDGPATNRMGAEHVKSLFSSSAAESMPIMAPWLTVCSLAVESPRSGGHGEQSSWISTFATLWELHLQSPADASEVATHLSGTATRLLGKLTGIPQPTSLGIEPAVQNRWTQDLRRFLTRNLILPARAAFLTTASRGVVQLAVDMSAPLAHITFPVLFDLVSRSPPGPGSATSRKDYDTWVQTVFDAIVHASKNASYNYRLMAMRAIIEMAAERGAALSAASLRLVCKDYAFLKDVYDWILLLSLIKLNPDVFLVSEDGKQLLEQVLDKTKRADSINKPDSEKAAQFIVLLAGGYAQTRDLSSFIKVWLTHVAPAKPKAGLQPLWAQKELSDTVGTLVQTSLNTNQLVEVIDWLSTQTEPTQSMARIYILDAISSGITQEESVDAANIKTFDGAFLEKFSKKELPIISACRWMVASKAISRGTLEEAGRIWSQIKSDIKSILRKSPIDQEDTFAAFRCCAAAWLANHPGAVDENDAAALICSFVERLEQDDEAMELDSSGGTAAINKGTYVHWILSDSPRLLSLLVEKNGYIPKGVLSLITVPGKEETGRVETALQASRLLLYRESSLNNHKIMDLLIESVISMITASKAGKSSPQTRIAIQFLLDTPPEAMSRTQREAAMKSLISHLPGDPDKAKAAGAEYWKLVLSLMVKLMGRPTFYEDMAFSDLDSIGQCLLKTHKRSSKRSSEGLATDGSPRDRDNLKVLRQLAISTIRQMASGSPEERERTYLKAAASLLQSPCQDSDVAPRIVLLHAFVSTVQASPALKKLQGDGLDLDGLKSHLLQVALPVVTSKKRTSKGLLSFLVALEALSDLDRPVVKQALSGKVSSLIEASDVLLESRAQAGWEVRMFVANHFPEALGSPLKVNMAVEAPAHTGEDEEDEAESGESAAALGKAALLQYVNAVVRSADEDTKLGYLQELLLEDSNGQDATGRLLAIYRLIQHLKGCRSSSNPAPFDLAQAHSLLCTRLQQSPTSPTFFLLTTHAIRLLLDQNPSCMTQWNIEVTLSTVSILSSTAPLPPAVLFPPLARLTETVIKRHRRRLDGHFHLLLTALQALLRLLLSPTAPSSPPPSEKNARLFSRLLTLICEPTVASVSHSSTTAAVPSNPAAAGSLDSEKDRARRYAGQFMYVVVMQYVKLQLEGGGGGGGAVVGHGVREALATGMYSVLDVTSADGMRIMSDGMDAGGRTVFREMWRMYQRFGKWSGV
ncbi:nucleolar pre-ribosomal-associated protein 2 [Staphylotrichum tortipilum]|uniref:Nucleolar pre-ribosomal-associated protein 2 n=1 Tax=Staphylotrichum tortipilum TaxID=2831512 RepID=A0AAN6MLF1_9PEZI|nr:nucleolar pre-ribosomal-associated protein 2 [Staphylotrichum longicolle]